MWKNIRQKVDEPNIATDSIDISSLFIQRLRQNVGNHITVGETGIGKLRVGQKERETQKEKEKKDREKNLSVKGLYVRA